MEHVLELIEQGQAGYVTAMGMGGVFTALLFLFLFITSLGKVYRFKKLRGQKPGAPASPARPPDADELDGAELAAAVAVSLALDSRGRRTSVSIPPGPAEEEPSGWKTAGRLAMMQPFVRPKKD